ncbi:peptidoglycan D,D-transpeptidase FtsI family protein [Butyricicoccus porcorum]|nr:penicillin-binding transpeptidase domain-containing protein [Butyricicoccus porcorum]
MKPSFKKRVQCIQTAFLLCAIAVGVGLVWTTLGNPESREAAAAETAQRTYLRGTIYDRDGKAINYSEEVNGTRKYTGGRAFSTVTGYFSRIYGTTGIEKTFNTELVSSKCKGDTKKGHDITLTLDRDLQNAAYDSISNIAEGAAVVLDAQTGEILALASTPTYEPETLEDNWSELCSVDGLFLPNAYKSTFAPGSDFKIITACAVIDNGVADTTVNDQGSYTFKNGQTITNYDSRAFGEIDLDGAIKNSSNVYFITKALEMGSDKLEASLRKFLLGEDIQLDFTTLSSNLDFEDYRDEVVGSIAFGQGKTEVTPLYMAMAAQAIGNDGVMLKPYMIQSIDTGDGKNVTTGQTTELTTVTSKETADQVTSAMTLAAEHYGFDYVGPEGWDIAAKTGTAQTGTNTNAWIVTFAPSENPKYVVVVMAAHQGHDGIYYKDSVDQLYDALVDYDQSQNSSSNSSNSDE